LGKETMAVKDRINVVISKFSAVQLMRKSRLNL